MTAPTTCARCGRGVKVRRFATVDGPDIIRLAPVDESARLECPRYPARYCTSSIIHEREDR